MKKISIIVLLLATITGWAIAWIDLRPNWDDTGISVMMVLLASALFGYLSPQKPWLTALVVSVWIPLASIAISNNFGALIALIPGFIGAYFGYFVKTRTGGR